MSSAVDELDEEGEELIAAPDTFILLSDPDVTLDDLAAVESVIRSSRLSSGAVVEEFEAAFAAYLGRKYAIATSSGTSGLLLALAAYGIGPGDEVIASPHSFRETQHAIALCGAQPVFVDIDYWSGVIAASKVEAAITERTKAIVGSNTNGHPASWDELKEIAKSKRVLLLEDFDGSDRLQIQRQAGWDLRGCLSLRFFSTGTPRLRRRRRGRHGRHRRRCRLAASAVASTRRARFRRRELKRALSNGHERYHGGARPVTAQPAR